MKKYYISTLAIIIILTIGFLIYSKNINNKTLSQGSIINTKSDSASQDLQPSTQNQTQTTADVINTFRAPIDRAGERVTKKPFGIFITPQNSPVQPERFSGYHTGTDFETFPEEQNIDVPIYAITDGKIVMKKSASGYGGVLVESAEINGQSVTIVYGHLNLASINKKVGDSLNAGEQIGVLGKGYSSQTDGERKHLHLGIHKGSSVNILGYIQNKSELSGWIDALSLL